MITEILIRDGEKTDVARRVHEALRATLPGCDLPDFDALLTGTVQNHFHTLDPHGVSYLMFLEADIRHGYMGTFIFFERRHEEGFEYRIRSATGLDPHNAIWQAVGKFVLGTDFTIRINGQYIQPVHAMSKNEMELYFRYTSALREKQS